ncbi:histidine kinase, partial [Streptomyces sp. NRRL F-6602]
MSGPFRRRSAPAGPGAASGTGPGGASPAAGAHQGSWWTRLRDRLRGQLHTGLRWKLSAAITLVGALVALALSLVVHNAARLSMLDNARDLQDERVQFAQRIYAGTG